MARTVTLEGVFDMYRDGVRDSTLAEKISGESITYFSRQVVNLASNTKNQPITFPTGLVTPKYFMIHASGGTMTFSKNTTETHHRVEDGGFMVGKGNFTSLCFSNNTTGTDAPAVTVTVALGG